MKTTLLTLLLSGLIVSGNNVFGQQQPQNPGFEFWEEFGFGPDILEPINWNSLKSSDGGDVINSVIPVTLERSTDANSGMYSAKLTNDTILMFVAPGAITNGRVHATLPPTDAYVYTIDSLPEFHTPFTEMPDSLTLWVRYFPAENDIAHITAILHTDTAKIPDDNMTNWIAVANIDITDEFDSWTRISTPFVYLSNETPEYILFAMFAGDGANAMPGSTLYIDDLELIYNSTGIASGQPELFNLFMERDHLRIIVDEHYQKDEFILEIFDLTGRSMVSTRFIPAVNNGIRINIPAGIYLCNIYNSSITHSQKIIIN
jgi:hypothetical protein